MSRQTISNWENDRTYPDVQNLFLLSNLFDVTIDQLIKGDLDIMEKSIDSETKNLRRLGLVCGILTVFMFLTLIVGFALYMKLNKSDAILYAMLAMVLITGILGIIAAAYIEQIKARNDVQTYREIKAFLSGEEVDRSKRICFEQKWLMPGNRYYSQVFKSHPIVGAVIHFYVTSAIGFFLGAGIVLTLIHIFGLTWLA